MNVMICNIIAHLKTPWINLTNLYGLSYVVISIITMFEVMLIHSILFV